MKSRICQEEHISIFIDDRERYVMEVFLFIVSQCSVPLSVRNAFSLVNILGPSMESRSRMYIIVKTGMLYWSVYSSRVDCLLCWK